MQVFWKFIHMASTHTVQLPANQIKWKSLTHIKQNESGLTFSQKAFEPPTINLYMLLIVLSITIHVHDHSVLQNSQRCKTVVLMSRTWSKCWCGGSLSSLKRQHGSPCFCCSAHHSKPCPLTDIACYICQILVCVCVNGCWTIDRHGSSLLN